MRWSLNQGTRACEGVRRSGWASPSDQALVASHFCYMPCLRDGEDYLQDRQAGQSGLRDLSYQSRSNARSRSKRNALVASTLSASATGFASRVAMEARYLRK
jgi:hypothetical protein